MSPHAHLARSSVGLADKVWLEAVGREPGENSPWNRSHVLAQRPKLASETLITQEPLSRPAATRTTPHSAKAVVPQSTKAALHPAAVVHLLVTESLKVSKNVIVMLKELLSAPVSVQNLSRNPEIPWMPAWSSV